MQRSKIGNVLTEVKKGIIVQQVNAQGGMGSGFAKSIMDKWPLVKDRYAGWIGLPYTQAESGRNYLGQVLYVEVEPGLYVANIVGQQFFGKDGKRYTSYDALDLGFEDVCKVAKASGITEVHYPLIGAGLGGGNWSIISAIINAQLDTIHHTLWVVPAMAHMIANGNSPQ